MVSCFAMEFKLQILKGLEQLFPLVISEYITKFCQLFSLDAWNYWKLLSTSVVTATLGGGN